MKKKPKILISPGEPSGIGYDILFDLVNQKFSSDIIVVTSYNLLLERAKILKKKINFIKVDINENYIPKLKSNEIIVHDIQCNKKVKIGKPSIKHAPLIIESLNMCINSCLEKRADAMVTGPVQKHILLKYGEKFSGHTEYIATKTGGIPIMMLHSKKIKIALLTTHVPLKNVPKLIKIERIKEYVKIISKDLHKKFGIKNPRINICGLNPHSGEDGYIGKEEKETISPAISSLKKSGYNVFGPYSADTIFTKNNADIILAMYHDQALPVIKTIGFGSIVNTTLGIPIVRTSVDHGTALDIAGTNKADASSLISAIKAAIDIVKIKND